MQPTLEIHPELHNEFHFADKSEGKGCCCFWKVKPHVPKEYYINKDDQIEPFNGTTHKVAARIIANKRLARLIEAKFANDPIESNLAFNQLRKKINCNFDGDEKITEERLIAIVNAIYQIRKEVNVKISDSD